MSRIQLRAINANLLVALDALLTTSSVGGAARRLGVTPSAMSHTLRQLRELLDDPLLVRGQRGMHLTPRAEALGPPLARALLDLERALAVEEAFDPSTLRRRFVIAAPDFIGVQLLSEVARQTAEEAPGIDYDLLPSARRGEAWRLETGQVDGVVGAILEGIPQVRAVPLYGESFVVIARRGHPLIDGEIDLERFAAVPHVLIGLDDEFYPERSWVHLALAKHGLERRVVLRERYFTGVVETVASTDFISPVPNTLARWGERRFGLQVLPAPLALPTYEEHLVYHERFEPDPAHHWLRQRIVEAARVVAGRTEAAPMHHPWEGPQPDIGQ